ncbi:holo-ACP synthase [Paenibacillus sp. GCM10023252]|uniref:holo-ACP synthase n=1 Tax=Paenibacillus sp. GCM10023252 TaxID=3252649 RepID=UPI003616C022
MIIGIGHDLAEVERFSALLQGKQQSRFINRILTGSERELVLTMQGERLAQFVAGRFAAKEAVVKALGCGIGRIVGFADMEIARGAAGGPSCLLSDSAWARLELEPQATSIHVTITHERNMASAFAVIERR